MLKFSGARTLTSPRPKVKSSANDFVLIRSVKLFLNNQLQSLPTATYGYVTWHYTTPSDEIVQLGNN